MFYSSCNGLAILTSSTFMMCRGLSAVSIMSIWVCIPLCLTLAPAMMNKQFTINITEWGKQMCILKHTVWDDKTLVAGSLYIYRHTSSCVSAFKTGKSITSVTHHDVNSVGGDGDLGCHLGHSRRNGLGLEVKRVPEPRLSHCPSTGVALVGKMTS